MDQNASGSIKALSDGKASKEDIVKQLANVSSGDGSVWSQLLSNPFFTAGFGLAGLGAALRYGSLGLRRAAELVRHRMLVDLEITRHDESYSWVLNWMTHQYQNQLMPLAQRERVGIVESLIRRLTPGLHHLQITTHVSRTASGSQQTAFALVPGHGRHILRYKNAFLAVNRERVGKSFDANGQPFETVKFTTLYYYRHIFEDIFQEAHQMAVQSTEGKTIVYTSRNVSWERSGEPKRRRPFESVVLDKGVSDRILADVREFLDARTWYLDRGIPYRRGYLLYGPPGTGKTSFVQALAGQLDYNIAMLSLSQRGLTDDLLNHLLLNVPARTIVLLEDADAAFSNRRQRDEEGYSGANVTYSGLLNALDGVASAEERIIFMTTNHIDRLDDALIRPGRVDMTMQLGNASQWQMEQLWDRFYSEQDPSGEGKRRFVQKAMAAGLVDNVSTAALQGLFLYNKGDVGGAIALIDKLAAHRPGSQPIQQQA
ncbi:Mitochondrial chaperone BCS1 [Fulvia fulva]|uniref:Mitochondrial chaperone BCS1 n=1 Tax=Passalora fulva TaxID=5499 RepID=A0A9Q8PC25_PASFU|nr:Mitochondrial chaperone BCS1 [Fulvia fulva]KAK4619706.1 Mitochondrial chaperone BCS1 [Fulvia fulva]KAK4620472.1 Mitochondrial chaperone BCS1 [Fulvia fulva]UJO19681.1 Mitochondrial chaperone BCS1 [Fulvia fulva]WPV17155.1 Mitochondrial chaperone BCS1 [Fulvia fulva]WPV32018.1 Mitochondrial chaperone BCS1 [Fulvia fulva]